MEGVSPNLSIEFIFWRILLLYYPKISEFSPENQWLEDDSFPFGSGYVMLVSGLVIQDMFEGGVFNY